MGTSDDVMIARRERERVAAGAGAARLRQAHALTGGGPDGNEQLTTVTGTILIVVLSTVGVFVTGIGLLIVGPTDRNPMLLLHKLTFIVWVVFMSLHVIGHLPAVARALDLGGRADMHPVGGTPGSAGRWIALTGAIVGGRVLAVALVPDFAAWTSHTVFLHHHHHH
jgi:hypothetical protein